MRKKKLEKLFNSEVKINGVTKKVNIVAILRNEDGSESFIPGANIVTDDGDQYYAEGAVGTPSWAVAGLRLGTGVSAPTKSDTDVTTVNAAGNKVTDATYPKTNDGDGDNTGSGIDIATWTVSYTTAEANITDIAEGAFVDNITTPTKALCHFLFAAPFTKTSSDTLKVIVNHQFNGV